MMIPDSRLTPTKREIQILKLVANGLSNKEIAFQLDIVEHTVKNHLLNMFGRLGFNSRVNAVVTSLKKGWIVLSEIEDKTLGRVADFGESFPKMTEEQIDRVKRFRHESRPESLQKITIPG